MRLLKVLARLGRPGSQRATGASVGRDAITSRLRFPRNMFFFPGKRRSRQEQHGRGQGCIRSRRGRRTRLVLHTDGRAGNLGDNLKLPSSTDTVTVKPRILQVIQLDADKITDAYKRKMLAPLEEILDEPAMESVREQFNGGCTLKSPRFDRFTVFSAIPVTMLVGI